MNILELRKKAIELRKRTWQLIHSHKNGHTGSDLSCADILVTLYYQVMNQTVDNFGKKIPMFISKAKDMLLRSGMKS